jgi:hypothetical protein
VLSLAMGILSMVFWRRGRGCGAFGLDAETLFKRGEIDDNERN